MNKKLLWFTTFLIVIMISDILSTQYALSKNGIHEGNPIMVNIVSNPLLFLIVKIIGTICIIAGMAWAIKRNENIATIGMKIISCLMFLVLINNLYVIDASATTNTIFEENFNSGTQGNFSCSSFALDTTDRGYSLKGTDSTRPACSATISSIDNYNLTVYQYVHVTPSQRYHALYMGLSGASSNSNYFYCSNTADEMFGYCTIAYNQFDTDNQAITYIEGWNKFELALYNNRTYFKLNNVAISDYATTLTGVTSVSIFTLYAGGLPTDYTDIDDISVTTPVSDPIIYDPSGYVKDANGTAIYNAKIQLSNATWTDPCIGGVKCWSDINGYWNTDIYANGNYTYIISKPGFNNLTGTQLFTMGGINYNFTLVGTNGIISGHIYEQKTSTGTHPIEGSLQDLKTDTQSCGTTIAGNTLVAGTFDTTVYAWKLKDVDTGIHAALFDLYRGNVVIQSDVLVYENVPQSFVILENYYESVSAGIRVNSLFQGSGGELNTAKVCSFIDHTKKTTSIIDFLLSLAHDVVMGFVFGSQSTPTILNFNDFFSANDVNNTSPIHFNASVGKNAIGYADFNVGSTSNIQNFYMRLQAESSSTNAAVVQLSYSDNTILGDPFTGVNQPPCDGKSVICINEKKNYDTDLQNFVDIDTNKDNIVRVWFKFYSNGASFNGYSLYMIALGAVTVSPLEGAQIYLNNNSVNSHGLISTLSDVNGYYSLSVPFGAYNELYSKLAYESKNYTLTTSLGVPSITQDVILNATNVTKNTTGEYIYVQPDPVIKGNQAYAFYKTFDHTNLLGGYQIAICPIGGGDCTYNDVSSNFEGKEPIDQNLGIGSYRIDLTGYMSFWDISRTVIATNNFTVLSSNPSVNWGSPIYYLNEEMKLSIYVPSGAENVTVYYPNGSVLATTTYSASSTIYVSKYLTSSNVSLNLYPFGIYRSTITNGTTATTQLMNISSSAYSLTAPSSVVHGTLLSISYVAPHTSTLLIIDSQNNVIKSVDVSGSSTYKYDTAILSNKADTLTIQLIRDSTIQKQVITQITIGGTDGGTAEDGEKGINNILSFLSMTAAWGFLAWIVIVYMSKYNPFISFVAFVIELILGLFDPFTTWLFAILVIGIVLIGIGKILSSGSGDQGNRGG